MLGDVQDCAVLDLACGSGRAAVWLAEQGYRVTGIELSERAAEDFFSENDLVFEDKGVTLVVDPEALPLIDGTEVDFVKNGLNEAFSFRNPNVTGECGCGESFNI